MTKTIKLIILIIISCSVYFIYQDTKGKNMNILNIGDGLAVGINSYGIKEYSYIDYYKDYLNKTKNVTIVNNYSRKDLSIDKLLDTIKTNPKLRRSLNEAHELIIVVGYNDIKYKMSLENNITKTKIDYIMEDINKNYEELIKEIRKYYKNNIYIIGYYNHSIDNYYLNYSIRKLNNILKENPEIIFINTENIANNPDKYFSNPNSYYPNNYGYEEIARRIIRKTLEKKEKL
ncbi:MAG: SGNH/GDSL hydrolase family protein [Bacilli bacterium]|nr:SGNH/GDSL hydrolase family protein [Bacilli bacterium]